MDDPNGPNRTPVDEQSVRQELRFIEQEAPPTGQERLAATRALRKMSEQNPDLQPTQDLTRLFVALR